MRDFYSSPNRLVASVAILVAAAAGLFVAGRGARGEDVASPPVLVRTDVASATLTDGGPAGAGPSDATKAATDIGFSQERQVFEVGRLTGSDDFF